MQFHKHNGRKVTIERVYKVGQQTLVDVRNPHNGKIYRAVPLEQIDSKDSHAQGAKKKPRVSFKHRKDGETILVKDSDEYQRFIWEHGLNPVFIENCLKGVSKTHKGYIITYVK